MFQRLKRGGWPYSQPPNVDFEVNFDSPQAEGLVAWWPPLASAGAGMLRDLAGRGLDGAFKGIGEPAWVNNAERGMVLDFDGVDDYVNAGNNLITIGSINRTVSVWIKTNIGSPQDIISWGSNIGDGHEWRNTVGGGNNRVATRVDAGYRTFSTTEIANGEWHHLVYILEGISTTDLSAYMDSQLLPVLDTSVRDIDTSIGNMSIGRRDAIAALYFNGFIDDVRIYNVAKTDAQVYQMYANPWELYRPRTRRSWVKSPVVANAMPMAMDHYRRRRAA